MPTWIIYVLDIFIAATVFMGWAWYMRWKYGRRAEGRIIAEFWTETGVRYRRLVEPEGNGKEIKAPQGHRINSYFYTKKTTGQTKYPLDPFLSMKFLQVDVPIVSWRENDPNPIDPDARAKPVATANLINSIKDEDFLAFASAASREIGLLQQELIKALATKLPKRVVYLGGLAILIAAVLGAIFGYQVLEWVEHIAGKVG